MSREMQTHEKLREVMLGILFCQRKKGPEVFSRPVGDDMMVVTLYEEDGELTGYANLCTLEHFVASADMRGPETRRAAYEGIKELMGADEQQLRFLFGQADPDQMVCLPTTLGDAFTATDREWGIEDGPYERLTIDEAYDVMNAQRAVMKVRTGAIMGAVGSDNAEGRAWMFAKAVSNFAALIESDMKACATVDLNDNELVSLVWFVGGEAAKCSSAITFVRCLFDEDGDKICVGNLREIDPWDAREALALWADMPVQVVEMAVEGSLDTVVPMDALLDREVPGVV